MGTRRRLFAILMLVCMLATLTVNPWEDSTAYADTINSPDKAEYLLDEDFSNLATSYEPNDIVPSGWDVKRAGGSISYSFNNWFKISDTSDVLPVSMNKKIRSQSSGTLTLEYRFKMPSVVNGVKWQLRSGATECVSLGVQNGSLVLEAGDAIHSLQMINANTEYGVKVIVNLDAKKVQTYVNGLLKAADKSFTHDVAVIDNFLVTTGDVTTGELFFAPVKIYKGYAVNEKFNATVQGPLPEDWQSQLNGGVIAVEKMDNSKPPDVFSLKMNATNAAGEMTIEKHVPSQEGKLIYEFKVFIPVKKDGFSAVLKNEDSTVFQWLTKDGKFAYKNASGQTVAFYDYIPNLWYHVKLKLNTVTGKADLYLNGKLKVEQIDIPLSSVNRVNFSIEGSNGGTMSLDDILLYHETAEPMDYVPAPVSVPSNGELVGTQACSLWREGST
ncbi:hypothetical protein [Paenibacillus sp. N3.4]|uniref:hypothetical protein n=1 Tax=Paenibacillus sp. N3.4 TaxID=2603222 RepID=UPI0011C9F3FA|nr:hypothetical protein [Paenibacillus sp. N3.4]TXK77662.1 hypothetical protein FU659_22215 [Paenibacillus sp. N3.4]